MALLQRGLLRIFDTGDPLRNKIGKGSLLMASVCLMLLLFSMIGEPYDWLGVRFVLILAAWFLLCLGYCHYVFAFKTDLTMTHVRLIDYLYLGTAAFGVFILAASYADQRNQLAASIFGPDSVTLRKLEALQIVKWQKERCVALTVVRVESCDPTRRFAELVERDASSSEIQKAYDDVVSSFESLLNSEMAERIGITAERLKDSLVLRALRDVIEFRKRAEEEAQRANTPTAVWLNRMRAAGQVVIWPFFLAFAFALRITKTTIEVFDWAASKPAMATSA